MARGKILKLEMNAASKKGSQNEATFEQTNAEMADTFQEETKIRGEIRFF